MMYKKPLLEILIPTYNRSHSAQEAIENILACNDERLTVRCNSNGFEPALEKYRNLDPRVNYDSFESNRGFQENLYKLLAETNAKFCMILSDEDMIDVNEYKKILSFLENLSSSISVVISSISYKEKSGFYWRPNQRFSEIDIHDCVALNPMPTYVSGYIFCVDALRDIDLKSFFNSSIGNVYHFTDVSLYLLPQS